jgi:hypothetical protein
VGDLRPSIVWVRAELGALLERERAGVLTPAERRRVAALGRESEAPCWGPCTCPAAVSDTPRQQGNKARGKRATDKGDRVGAGDARKHAH